MPRYRGGGRPRDVIRKRLEWKLFNARTDTLVFCQDSSDLHMWRALGYTVICKYTAHIRASDRSIVRTEIKRYDDPPHSVSGEAVASP